MSKHYSDDDNRLHQIDNLLRHGQTSGQPLLDELAGTQPQPDAHFVDALEARLLNRLAHTADADISQTTNNDEEPHIMHIKQKRTHPQTAYITLAAAVLAIVVAGGLLLTLYTPPPSGTPLAGGVIAPQQDNNTGLVTATPVPRMTDTPDNLAADIEHTATALLVTSTPTAIPASPDAADSNSNRVCLSDSTEIVFYTLKEGDTLFRVAQRFKLPVDELATLNCLSSPQHVRAGQLIALPAAVATQPDTAQVTLLLAAEDIPMGTIITDAMLYEVAVSEDVYQQIEDDAAVQSLLNQPEQAAGQVALTFIPRYQPLNAAVIAAEEACEPLEDCLGLPVNYKTLQVTSSVIADSTWADWLQGGERSGEWLDYLQRGQRVDVVLCMKIVAPVDDATVTPSTDASDVCTIMEHVSLNAIVNRITGSGADTTLELLLNADDAHLLEMFIETGFPMKFVPAIPDER
jgi:LysM repeat protein